MEKLKGAFQLGTHYSFGAAFDLDLQEQKRLLKLTEKELKRKEEKRIRKEAKREKQREILQEELKQI